MSKHFSMHKNANKLQNVEACLHFPASKRPLTQVGMSYKSKPDRMMMEHWITLNNKFPNYVNASHNTTFTKAGNVGGVFIKI